MKKNGQTVIELLIVVVIAILLLTMLIPKHATKEEANDPVTYIQKHGLKSVVGTIWNGTENTVTNQ